MNRQSGFAWNVHHNKQMEWCYDFAERRRAIRKKPAHEVKLRLKWFRCVKGRLPKYLLDAGATFDKARAALGEAWAAYNKAWTAYGKAGADLGKTTVALDQAEAAIDKTTADSDKARAAYNNAIERARPTWEKLYAIECADVNWDGSELMFEEQADKREDQ